MFVLSDAKRNDVMWSFTFYQAILILVFASPSNFIIFSHIIFLEHFLGVLAICRHTEYTNASSR